MQQSIISLFDHQSVQEDSATAVVIYVDVDQTQDVFRYSFLTVNEEKFLKQREALFDSD